MVNYFVPYAGSKPAVVTVNGHKLLILANDKKSLREKLTELGATQVKRIQFHDTKGTDAELSKLSRSVQAKIVVAPDNVKIDELLLTLEDQLPWLQ